jgi:nucleotide-binding universal stress UspA family protein
VKLAEEAGAQIGVVHVVDSSRIFASEFTPNHVLMESLERNGNITLENAESHIPATLRHEQWLMEGEPAETILDMARQWHADLIIVGTDNRGRVAHFLLGSTADAVIRRAPCPVMTVRAAEGEQVQPLMASSTADSSDR